MPSYPPGFTLIRNSLAAHKLAQLRDETCEAQRFRRLVRQLGFLLCSAATEDLPLNFRRAINTPAGAALDVEMLDQDKFLVLVLLRAGLVVAEGFQELLPRASVGHLGFFHSRSEDEVVPYLSSIPEGVFTTFFLVASAITTGSSMAAAVRLLTEHGVPAESIRVSAILVSRRGLEAVYADPAHRGVRTFAVACDEGLSASGEVIPGFGKAGNRVFGTIGDAQ